MIRCCARIVRLLMETPVAYLKAVSDDREARRCVAYARLREYFVSCGGGGFVCNVWQLCGNFE